MSSWRRTGAVGAVVVVGWALALGLSGCGGSGDAKGKAMTCAPSEVAGEDGVCAPKACGPGELLREDGSCQPAALPPDMPCPAGQLALEDGACQPAGVPPEACAEGFIADGNGGCAAILPDGACPPGQMAIPGETRCREVASCGEGTWGDIPVESTTTQFVDQTYIGGDSDGTRERPWVTIQRAIAAAADGAIVAVAAGSYVEDVVIEGKAVRLVGRCPALVELQGVGGQPGAVQVRGRATGGTEIRSLAISGAQYGIMISRAREIAIEAVWVHDAGSFGILVVDSYDPMSVVVKSSLIEQNRGVGVLVVRSDATIEASVIKGTLSDVDGKFGRGIVIQDDRATDEHANVTVRACLIEQNHDVGVAVFGSDATIEGTVVKGTLPDVDGKFGRGIVIQDDRATAKRANATVRGCLVEQNRDAGVFVAGLDATIEATVVKGTQATADGQRGLGIVVQHAAAASTRADVTVRACLVEQNHNVGVLVRGSDATLEATVVKGTQPNAGGKFGWGIGVQRDTYTHTLGSDVTVRACLVDQNHVVGVAVFGSVATLEATLVRGTLHGPDGRQGRGIDVEPDDDERADITVRDCLIEDNYEMGLFVGRSDAVIETSVVRGTKANDDGTFGDGVAVQNGTVTLEDATVSGNARAGVANWGSQVRIVDTTLTCNAFALNGEAWGEVRASFDESRGWRCTRRGADDCAETDDRCVVDSANLEPPPRLAPL